MMRKCLSVSKVEECFVHITIVGRQMKIRNDKECSVCTVTQICMSNRKHFDPSRINIFVVLMLCCFAR